MCALARVNIYTHSNQIPGYAPGLILPGSIYATLLCSTALHMTAHTAATTAAEQRRIVLQAKRQAATGGAALVAGGAARHIQTRLCRLDIQDGTHINARISESTS